MTCLTTPLMSARQTQIEPSFQVWALNLDDFNHPHNPPPGILQGARGPELMHNPRHYQDSGWIDGKNSKALNLANKAIAAAKRATPDGMRQLFRSSIRYLDGGYSWWWILKG